MVLISAFIALSLTVTEVFSVQVCGKALADMLDLVCDGRGFHWIPREGIPTISKRTAVQYLGITTPPTTSNEGGVVTECCRKACSLSHMESYCAASPGTYFQNPTSGPIPSESIVELMKTNVPQPTPQPPSSTTRSAIVSTRPTGRFAGFRRRYGYGAKFFFVRPVGPRPTRTPVVSL